VDRDETHRRRALELGLVDEVSPELAGVAERADVVVACTPVDCIAAGLIEAARCCPTDTLLTDVGSTKVGIVRAVEEALSAEHLFVGSHPLAGSEKRGPEHADGWLFEGRLVIVTPTPRTNPLAVERATAFWGALGARVRRMPPEEHDRGVALSSHLPHLVASALAGVLPPALAELAASGFRDTTRLASGDPGLWTAICSHNREFLLEALGRFAGRLEDFRQALEAGDGRRLFELFQQGKQARQATF
jgi:prephenate dehydrogenase